MTPQAIIRFSQLRSLIDAGKQLTEMEGAEYDLLLPSILREVPTNETPQGRDTRERLELLQRVFDLERQVDHLLKLAHK